MKTRTASILSVATLTIMVVAAFTMLGSGDPPLPADVKFKPRHLDGVNMATVRAEIRLYDWVVEEPGEDPVEVPIMDQIDPSTVVLEGWVTPVSTSLEYADPNAPYPKLFVAMFPGSSVRSAIISIIYHMGIIPDKPWNPIEVSLTVSGLLYAEYGSTPWQGTGTVKVTFSEIIPDPNP
jgi:hypothetical protein